MNANIEERQDQRADRVVKLEGAYNMRDLGGYATKDGRQTRWGRFFRADGLHRLTAEDQQEILGRNVRTVVDLRHAKELEESPNVFASSTELAYHNISLINPAGVSEGMVQSLGDLYVDMMESCQPLLRQVFELLAEDTEEAALYHCAAGKDRTGVVSALLLDLAGVSRETIVEDYSLTEACIAPMIAELRLKNRDAIEAAVHTAIEAKGEAAGAAARQAAEMMFERFMGSAPDNMVMFLDALYSRYGGGEKYLLTIGLTEEQIGTLKRKLLD